MSEFPFQRVLEFMTRVVPFDTLEEEELGAAVGALEIAFFPKGTRVLEAGGPPSRFLYIIHSGWAQVSLPEEEGQEPILVDQRAEGDTFGAISLLQARQAVFTVTAGEDLICYLLPSGPFRALVERYPAFKRHFQFSLARNLQAMRREQDQGLPQMTGLSGVGLDAALARSPVRELMSSPVLTCRPATPARAAARLMTQRQVGSVLVVDESGHPAGIVTDTDFRVRLVAGDHGPLRPVAEFMSSPVHQVDPATMAFEALLEMSRHGVHHLLVSQDDRPVGMICDHDLQASAGSSPVGVINDIAKVSCVDELVLLHPRMDRVLEMLLRMGGSAETMLELVTEFNDRLTLRLMELVGEEMEQDGAGRPPVPYVWLALGSEGRREQTLRTDQDNALIFANTPGPQLERVQKWFLNFAERVVDGLERCGFPRCQGEVMASNPAWCQTERQWRETFLAWVGQPSPETLRLASIFFDYRGLYAEADFVEGLEQVLARALEGNRLFLRALAKNSLYNRPPLGFLRQFVVLTDGEHKNQLNLKLSGLTPVVDAMRVMALDQGVRQTNTLRRLEEVRRRGLLGDEFAADLREAFCFIVILRITHHLEARARREPPDNYVDPARLNGLQRKMLKESFAVIKRLQEMLEQRYQTWLLT